RFCYVCGFVIFMTVKKTKKTRKTKTRFDSPWIKPAYVGYFKTKFDDRADWAPDTICDRCYTQLYNWYHRIQRVRLFVRPVCWLNPLNHESECFFCNTSLIGTNIYNRENLQRYHFQSDTVT